VEAHVHGGVAFHLAGEVEHGLLVRGGDDLWPERRAEEEDDECDHDGTADELGCHEAPAEEDGEENAELDDQIGGGELEGDGGDEVCAFAEERAREGGCCVGAGGAGCAESRGDDDGLCGRIGEELADFFLGDAGFDGRREEEAEA